MKICSVAIAACLLSHSGFALEPGDTGAGPDAAAQELTQGDTQAVVQAAAAVRKETIIKGTTSWNGSDLPGYAGGTPEITILKYTIAPGASLPMHEHPYINAGVLLSGELTVVSENNDVLHLRAGEALIEMVGQWHRGSNEGSRPAEIIVFYAGIKDQPLTVTQAP